MATLVYPQSADPIADAEALRQACEGWGTNEKGITEIIAHRSSAQLKLIKDAYFQAYGEDLIKRFEKELTGDFERAVYRWMLEPFDREAVLINVALKNKDLKVVVELACTSSSEELLGIRRAYQHRYKYSLEEDVACHSTGDVRKLLLLLVSAYRYESTQTNPKLAESEAAILHKAVSDKEYNHEEVIRVVTTRSKAHIVATLFAYEDANGAPFSKHLEEAGDDQFVALLRVAAESLKSTKEYLEGVLRTALEKRGTDEDSVTRIIVTRAEKDLAEIKDFYYQRNGVALELAIAKDTHGDYERFLLALLGAEGH